MKKNLFLITLFLCLSILFTRSVVALPAFPGAEGFGSDTIGGRGGTVIEVTNLNASGSGSFLEACEASGPRIVVFRTGGTITVTSNIYIYNPYITIAGQTAPGDGICIRGAALKIATHDVIVRGLRVRAGDDPDGPSPSDRDAISVANPSTTPYNVIVDHCSASWSLDENMGTWYAANDITFQWNICSEPITRGEGNRGMIIGYDAQRISMHHNLFIHCHHRNPLIEGHSKTEFVNNVIYGWRWHATHMDCAMYVDQPCQANFIKNHYIESPETLYEPSLVKEIFIENCNSDDALYISENIGPNRTTNTGDDWLLAYGSQASRRDAPTVEDSGITIHDVEDVYDVVLANAGAIIPYRDSVDNRVVADVQNRTGGFLDSQDDVGGWPTLAAGTAPTDTDHDGMPDDWETMNGLDPNNPGDGNEDRNSDGYTNIEEYINGLISKGYETAPSSPKNLKIN